MKWAAIALILVALAGCSSSAKTSSSTTTSGSKTSETTTTVDAKVNPNDLVANAKTCFAATSDGKPLTRHDYTACEDTISTSLTCADGEHIWVTINDVIWDLQVGKPAKRTKQMACP